MTSHRLVLLALALVVGTWTAACRPTEQKKTETVRAPRVARVPEMLPPAVQAQIDSGNAAFTAGDHRAALDHYARAKDMKDDVAAAWFGMYMARHALGDEDGAKEALTQARRLSPAAARPDSPQSHPTEEP